MDSHFIYRRQDFFSIHCRNNTAQLTDQPNLFKFLDPVSQMNVSQCQTNTNKADLQSFSLNICYGKRVESLFILFKSYYPNILFDFSALPDLISYQIEFKTSQLSPIAPRKHASGNFPRKNKYIMTWTK